MMISPPPLGFSSHLLPWTCCSCPYHLCTLPAPVDVSEASSPAARALGWTAKVGKANLSHQGPLALEWRTRAPWPPAGSREKSDPRESAPPQGSMERAHLEGDALHCRVTILRTSIFCSTSFGSPPLLTLWLFLLPIFGSCLECMFSALQMHSVPLGKPQSSFLQPLRHKTYLTNMCLFIVKKRRMESLGQMV